MQPCRHSSKRWGWWSTPHTLCGWSLHWGHWAPHLLICFGVHSEPIFYQGCSVNGEGRFYFSLFFFFFWLSHSQESKWRDVFVCWGQDAAHKGRSLIFTPSSLCCVFFLHPQCFPSPFRVSVCSRCPRSVCHREHKLFSLGCSDSMIGVYKQAYQAGMTCTQLPPKALLYRYQICPSCLFATVSLPVSHLQWVSPSWGGLHRPLPLESQANSLSCTPETWLTVN